MAARQISAANGTPLQTNPEPHDHSRYTNPSVPLLQQPPVAHVAYGKRPSEGQTTVHTARSSASGSSDLSYHKQYTPSSGSRWPSPAQAHTLVNSDQYYSSQSTRWQPYEAKSREHSRKRSNMTADTSPALAYVRDRRQIEEEVEDEEENDHALWVLFWLSCLDSIHTITGSLFTIFVTLGLIIASPIRLVHTRSSFGDQIIRTLAPLFKNHLDMMYASSVDHAFEWDFRPGMLILIQTIAPFISLGVAVAAWVTAAFWVFTSIMGNPDGTEKRDDGADAVLAIRNWYERCLLKALRPRESASRPQMRAIV